MSEFQHGIHFVGSYPADTAEAAMSDMLYYGGKAVSQISDGETGHRQNWVVSHIDSYRDNDAFTLTKDGGWTSYEDCPEFDVAPGHRLTAQDLNLQYHSDAVASWQTFKQVREQYNRPDIKFQVGVPHALDMSLFTFGLARGLDPELLDTYTKATVEQFERIRNEPFGDEVVFQIETPASMSVALLPQDQLPNSLQPEALGQQIADLANQAPEQSHFGIHLCLGDLGNESRGQLPDRSAAVALMNAIASGSAWRKQSLDYIHEPHAAGKNPPILRQDAYEDLRDLRLPAGSRYVAGIVHEDQLFDDQRLVMGWIKEALPKDQLLDIATACGLGRRQRSLAQFLSQRSFDLVHRLEP